MLVQRKRPVGRTPIAEPGVLRGIDPVWTRGPVPERFWEEQTNRRDYLLWLGEKLGYRYMSDWYKLTVRVARGKHKALSKHWRRSPAVVLRDCFPEYDWQEWLFACGAPWGFWDRAENRRRYMDWLGRQLGFHSPYSWRRIRTSAFMSHRGQVLLRRYSSVAELLHEYLPRFDLRLIDRFRRIELNDILIWMDVYYSKHGKWPSHKSGPIPGTVYTWCAIDNALRQGHHGLPGGSSMARVRTRYRSVRALQGRKLTEDQILAWADAYFAKHGKWPTPQSPDVAGLPPGDTWCAVEKALYDGNRGLPGGGITLARLFQARRGAIPRLGRKLTVEQILAWADAHYAAQGRWPTADSQPGPPNETWCSIDTALREGRRGLPAGASLARLLAKQPGVPNPRALPRLTVQRILAWAKRHRQKTGKWPSLQSGPVPRTKRETWAKIDAALRAGRRGLPGGMGIGGLLKKHGLK